MPKENYFNGDFEAECNKMLKCFDDQSTSCVMNDAMLNILNDNVTKEEIICALSILKKKSPGFDLIPAECVKYVIDFIKPHLFL